MEQTNVVYEQLICNDRAPDEKSAWLEQAIRDAGRLREPEEVKQLLAVVLNKLQGQALDAQQTRTLLSRLTLGREKLPFVARGFVELLLVKQPKAANFNGFADMLKVMLHTCWPGPYREAEDTIIALVLSNSLDDSDPHILGGLMAKVLWLVKSMHRLEYAVDDTISLQQRVVNLFTGASVFGQLIVKARTNALHLMLALFLAFRSSIDAPTGPFDLATARQSFHRVTDYIRRQKMWTWGADIGSACWYDVFAFAVELRSAVQAYGDSAKYSRISGAFKTLLEAKPYDVTMHLVSCPPLYRIAVGDVLVDESAGAAKGQLTRKVFLAAACHGLSSADSSADKIALCNALSHSVNLESKANSRSSFVSFFRLGKPRSNTMSGCDGVHAALGSILRRAVNERPGQARQDAFLQLFSQAGTDRHAFLLSDSALHSSLIGFRGDMRLLGEDMCIAAGNALRTAKMEPHIASRLVRVLQSVGVNCDTLCAARIVLA